MTPDQPRFPSGNRLERRLARAHTVDDLCTIASRRTPGRCSNISTAPPRRRSVSNGPGRRFVRGLRVAACAAAGCGDRRRSASPSSANNSSQSATAHRDSAANASAGSTGTSCHRPRTATNHAANPARCGRAPPRHPPPAERLQQGGVSGVSGAVPGASARPPGPRHGRRAAAFGVTEEQARETPCRSALSVGGIIKHAAYIMRGALERLRTEVTEQPVDAAAYAVFTTSFAVRDDETVAGTIEDFDRVRARLLAMVAATDPAGDTMAPPAPSHGSIFPGQRLADPEYANPWLVPWPLVRVFCAGRRLVAWPPRRRGR